MSNSPTCLPYSSYEVSSDYLVLDQLITPLIILTLIPVICLLDIVLILRGEILSWSPIGVKGLCVKELLTIFACKTEYYSLTSYMYDNNYYAQCLKLGVLF